MIAILEPEVTFANNVLKGKNIDRTSRKIKDLADIFSDRKAYSMLPCDSLVYEVALHCPVTAGTEGGLFYGITYIYPGLVGDEYFMTKGHFHKIRNRAEIYCTLQGQGMLILMDEQRRTWGERMYPGSIHYIAGNTAHRTANTGDTVFSFTATWPSDAGLNYTTISEEGFSKILIRANGVPKLVENPRYV